MGVFFRELKHHRILRAVGKDFQELLHRLSTNDVLSVKLGSAGETILTTEKGRTIDVIQFIPGETGTLILVSPGKWDEVHAWLEKYTIMEDVRYEDASSEYAQFEANGNDYEQICGAIFQRQLPPWSVIQDDTKLAVHHHSVTGPGIRILIESSQRDTFIEELTNHYPFISPEGFELWRVMSGYPAVGHELSLDFNPLESGAGSLISSTKGCYIGQEVIARLDAYNKVQRHLKKLRIESLVAGRYSLPRKLRSGDGIAGFLTSLAYDPAEKRSYGLGLVRTAFESPGSILDFDLDDVSLKATVVE